MSSLRLRRTARSTVSWSERPDRPGLPRAGRRIYLDYAGFSPVDPRVLAVMSPFLEGWVGNPSALHALGQEARDSLDAARAKIGRLVGGRPEGVVFTSGATEANNLAIKGIALRGTRRHVVTTAIEPASVLAPCRDLVKAGFDVPFLPVDGEGRVAPAEVRAALRPDTCLGSIGAANPEIGTIQPWRAIATITHEAGVPLHLDGVGAVGRVPLAVEAGGIDLLTLAANDLYGPPGVGALWVRPGLQLVPQLLGGGQQRGLRSGTENLAGGERPPGRPARPADRRAGGHLFGGAAHRPARGPTASPRQRRGAGGQGREPRPGARPGRDLGGHRLGGRGADRRALARAPRHRPRPARGGRGPLREPRALDAGR